MHALVLQEQEEEHAPLVYSDPILPPSRTLCAPIGLLKSSPEALVPGLNVPYGLGFEGMRQGAVGSEAGPGWREMGRKNDKQFCYASLPGEGGREFMGEVRCRLVSSKGLERIFSCAEINTLLPCMICGTRAPTDVELLLHALGMMMFAKVSQSFTFEGLEPGILGVHS